MAKRAEETATPRRFWQANRSLPAILWDPKQNRTLVEFKRGTAIVTDPAVAERLLAEGYVEIPLDGIERPVPLLDAAPIHGMAMAGGPQSLTSADVGITDGGFLGKDARPREFAASS